MAASIVFAYITCRDKSEARSIGKALVEQRLASCVNIFDGMTSFYRWKGKMEEASEVVLIAKTAKSRFDKLSARVKELHSYKCPCILQLEVKKGNKEYVNWLLENIK